MINKNLRAWKARMNAHVQKKMHALILYHNFSVMNVADDLKAAEGSETTPIKPVASQAVESAPLNNNTTTVVPVSVNSVNTANTADDEVIRERSFVETAVKDIDTLALNLSEFPRYEEKVIVPTSGLSQTIKETMLHCLSGFSRLDVLPMTT